MFLTQFKQGLMPREFISGIIMLLMISIKYHGNLPLRLYDYRMQQGKHYFKKTRLGLIDFINCLPIVLPIKLGLIKVESEVILDEPSKLNHLFSRSQLDYGALSAFAFLQQSDSLMLLPSVSIASRGPVNSVLFFSKKSIEISCPAKIAVPLSSATSINAMRLMLAHSGHENIEIEAVPVPCLNDNIFDAALVIGDRALLVDQEWSAKYSRYDIGQWWFSTFNMPMVFGLFAARTEWVDDSAVEIGKEEIIKKLGMDLQNAAQAGLTEYFPLVLDEAVRRTGLDRDRLTRYYQNDLDFSWTKEHYSSLLKYEFLCRSQGMLEKKKVLA